MALSTKKKNIILAMWKTGEFRSATALGKHYKISTKTAQKIIAENPHSNEPIIDLGVQYELAKNSTKNPHEIKSIEKVVSERIKSSNLIHDLTSICMDGLESSLKSKKKDVPTKMGVVQVDLSPADYKAGQDAIDKASITLGVNERFSSAKVEVNTQNNIQTIIEIE